MGVRLVKYSRTNSSSSNSGGQIYNDHDELTNRDLKNQHPIYAITGLQEVLNVLEDSITETNKLIIATNERIDAILLDIEKIQKEIQDIYNIINNLNIIKDVQDTSSVDMEYDDTTKILKADVKVYEDKNHTNAIKILEDGLYVPRIMTEDSKTVTWDTIRKTFDEGIKFSHVSNSWNNKANTNEANSWYWDIDSQMFVQPSHTGTFNGFVTETLYDCYEHQVTICSSGADNDINGIVIGFVMDENNHPHTLSILLNRENGAENSWKLVYDYCLPDAKTLFTSGNGEYGTVPSNFSSDSWNTIDNGITVYITKNKNMITVTASNWNELDLNEDTTITIDLDEYSWGYLFHGPVRYGYCNKSQSESYFKNIDFVSTNQALSTLFTASVKISNEDGNAIIEKDDGIYAPEFIVSPDDNNALVKKDNGYFVEGFQLSQEEDNCLKKLQDGLYVREHSNIKLVTQTNHGFIIGDFIYYHPNNQYQLASAIDDYDSNIVGMVTKVIDENTFEYQWSGFYKTDLFTSKNGYTQGVPIYISSFKPGKVTQKQPDISKAVGYPVEDIGLIISIERGIQYNQEASIGDFKTSANTYDVRSDGFIRVAEGIEYKQTLIERLLNALNEEFMKKYIVLDNTQNTLHFINVDELYTTNEVPLGLNLFIKAF